MAHFIGANSCTAESGLSSLLNHLLHFSFSELSFARALLIHLLPLPHGDPRHPLHQDGAQNQADFGDPAKSAEATPAQRAHHAADGTAAAGTIWVLYRIL